MSRRAELTNSWQHFLDEYGSIEICYSAEAVHIDKKQKTFGGFKLHIRLESVLYTTLTACVMIDS